MKLSLFLFSLLSPDSSNHYSTIYYGKATFWIPQSKSFDMQWNKPGKERQKIGF
jgi:hypothetical protein